MLALYVLCSVVVALAAYIAVRGALASRPARPPADRWTEDLPGPPCAVRVREQDTYTEFVADLAGVGGALRVRTGDWGVRLERFYGTHDVSLGDPEFDSRFVVQGRPESLARDLLDAGVRQTIRRLEAGRGRFLFQLRPGQLAVRVPGRVAPADRRAFLDDGRTLIVRVLGVERGVQMEGMTLGEGDCRVCGTAIGTADRVLCARCSTPHHEECWTFVGHCAIFACGEQRSRTA